MASALPVVADCCGCGCDIEAVNLVSFISANQSFQNYSALRSYTGYFLHQIALILGLNVAGDGLGGGWYFFDTASMAADSGDGGLVIRPNDIAVGSPGRWLKEV